MPRDDLGLLLQVAKENPDPIKTLLTHHGNERKWLEGISQELLQSRGCGFILRSF